MEVNGEFHIGEPKTKKGRRLVHLAPIAVEALQEHRRRMLAEGRAGTEWVFCDTAGGILRRQNVLRRSFQPLLKSAGLRPIRFHDLRHTCATLLLSANVHPKIVQEQLGHSRTSITLDIYSHVLPAMAQEAASRMDRILSAKGA